MNWYYAEGNKCPAIVDKISSKKWVYIRRNIEEFEREDEIDPTIKKKFYKWEEMKIPKENYPIYELEVQNAAKLDYLAMMSDIDLDSCEDEYEGE
jgi:hypothetical protein